MSSEVRDYRPTDEAAVREVYCASWHFLAHEVLKLKGERFDPLVAPLRPSVVATIEGEVVGFCEVQDSLLHRIYVHPDVLGRGVGALLLSRAVELGARHLWVDEGNHMGRDFYEAQGWTWDGLMVPGSNWPEYGMLRYSLLVG